MDVGPNSSAAVTADGEMAPIVIVEDNKMNMRLFRDVLMAMGYPVLCAESAEIGLELLRDSPMKPGAIIMDIQLPGMSGADCATKVKADPETADIPIIAVTAFSMPGDEARFRRSGCDDYLSKPISVPQFAATIGAHYRKGAVDGA